MHNLPFNTVSLAADDVQALEDAYKALCAKFSISLPGDVDLSTKSFDLFINPDVSIGGVLRVDNTANNLYLVFVKIHYSSYGLRSATREDWYKYQVWAFIKSGKDFGRVLIRHETFNDRIVGLLHPVEVEFKDDKLFDHKFYVVSNDEQNALSAITWSFRNAVMDMGACVVIETAGHSLIIGDNTPVTDPQQVVALTEFAVKIAALK